MNAHKIQNAVESLIPILGGSGGGPLKSKQLWQVVNLSEIEGNYLRQIILIRCI